MLRCHEVAELVSQSMEQKLPWRTRLQMRIHFALCRFCAGFAAQWRQLRQAIHDDPERLAPAQNAPEGQLSAAARERLKAALRQG